MCAGCDMILWGSDESNSGTRVDSNMVVDDASSAAVLASVVAG